MKTEQKQEEGDDVEGTYVVFVYCTGSKVRGQVFKGYIEVFNRTQVDTAFNLIPKTTRFPPN